MTSLLPSSTKMGYLYQIIIRFLLVTPILLSPSFSVGLHHSHFLPEQKSERHHCKHSAKTHHHSHEHGHAHHDSDEAKRHKRIIAGNEVKAGDKAEDVFNHVHFSICGFDFHIPFSSQNGKRLPLFPEHENDELVDFSIDAIQVNTSCLFLNNLTGEIAPFQNRSADFTKCCKIDFSKLPIYLNLVCETARFARSGVLLT